MKQQTIKQNTFIFKLKTKSSFLLSPASLFSPYLKKRDKSKRTFAFLIPQQRK